MWYWNFREWKPLLVKMAVPLPYLGGLAAFILTLLQFDSMCFSNVSGRGEWLVGWVGEWLGE